MRPKFPKPVLSLAVKQETVGGFKPLATVTMRHKSKFSLVVHTSKQTLLCLKVQYSTKSAIFDGLNVWCRSVSQGSHCVSPQKFDSWRWRIPVPPHLCREWKGSHGLCFPGLLAKTSACFDMLRPLTCLPCRRSGIKTKTKRREACGTMRMTSFLDLVFFLKKGDFQVGMDVVWVPASAL